MRAARLLFLALVVLPLQARAQADDPAQPATVTVTGKKEAVVRALDKTVHDVSTMARAANGSAQDVLQATPELAVTADGQIVVKGNAQVTVLVDGKPTAMLSGTGEERALALQTMSGADIASVEVITTPSAAYNANGGAIVNIVLKRNRKPGAHAQFQGSASDRGLWNVGASGDGTGKAVSVHGSLALRHDGTEKFRQSAVDWTNPVSGATGQTRQASEVFVHRVVASAAVGVDVNLSDVDTLSLSTRYNDRRSRPLFDVLNDNQNGAGQTLFHRISEGPNTQSDAGASLSLTHRDSDKAIKASVQHSDTTALVDKSYRDVFLAPLRPTDDSHGATRSTRRLDQATLDWTQGTAHGQWGAGLDVQDKADAMANYQAAIDPSTGIETPDPATTNDYTVKTTLSAAYLTDQVTLGPWELLLGGRAERMALRVRPAQDTTAGAHWQAFNPSLHVKYAVGDGADVTLSYRRSLQMPDPRDLNPNTTYIDAQNLSHGNPALAPQRLGAWEIGSHVQVAHVSGELGAFYRTSRNTVTDARSFIDDVLITSRQNGGQARSAGITGALDWTPAAAPHLGIDGGVYRVQLATPDVTGLVHQHGVAGYVNLRAGWRIGSGDVALDAHAQSAGVAPLGRFGPTSSVNLTWKHPLTKTLSVTVNANDVFDGSRRTYATTASTFRQTGFDHFVAQRIYVGLVKKIE